MWLGPVPWAGRHWALPRSAPSSRYHQGTRHSHRLLVYATAPLIHRPLVLVGDMPCLLLPVPGAGARLRLDPVCIRTAGQRERRAATLARKPSLTRTTWPGTSLRCPGTTAPLVVELTSQTAVWYRSGKPAVTIRPSATPRAPTLRFWNAVGNWRSPSRRFPPGYGDRVSGPTWPLLAADHPGRPCLPSSHYPAHL